MNHTAPFAKTAWLEINTLYRPSEIQFNIYYFLLFLNVIWHYSSFQCHTILQKSVEYADLVLLLSMLEIVVLLNIFVETNTLFFQASFYE